MVTAEQWRSTAVIWSLDSFHLVSSAQFRESRLGFIAHALLQVNLHEPASVQRGFFRSTLE